MLAALLIVAPVFGLVAVGFLARKTRILDDRAGNGLSRFVFAVALPCLIFRTLARGDLPLAEPWGYWASYFLALAIAWIVGSLVARHAFGTAGIETVVAGFSAGQANLVLIGVPLILQAFGEAAAVPLFLLIAIHLPITMSAATILVEGRNASFSAIARKLATHPIILGIAAGVLARPIAGELPAPLWQMIDMLAAAAAPGALVAMGVALSRYGLSTGVALPATIAACKLLLHPLLVLFLATFVFPVPREWVPIAVMFAACPSGINAYLLAQSYKTGVALASSAVALSTVLAVATMSVWLYVVAG